MSSYFEIFNDKKQQDGDESVPIVQKVAAKLSIKEVVDGQKEEIAYVLDEDGRLHITYNQI